MSLPTFQPLIKCVKCIEHSVTSKTSERILLTNVGSQPLLRTTRFEVRINSRRDSPFALQSVLPHAEWWAFASHPNRRGVLLIAIFAELN